jgi:tetratricopeptide (TPR) repeat protein
MNKTIEDLVVDLSTDPFNPDINFQCAIEYEKLNQTASAVSFYLRAAEFGIDTHKDIVYTSLLKIAECFQTQKDRQWNVTNYILHAVSYMPERPEAYFLMSQYYEREGAWLECYVWAQMGINANHSLEKLPLYVGYDGFYCLEFEKAVSGWWIGQRNESKMLFNKILEIESITDIYREAIKFNLEKI